MNRIQNLIKNFSENADCALITSDINRRYFTGMKSSAGTLLIFKDTAYLLVDFRYYEKACEIVKDAFVIRTENYFEQLNEYFKKHNAHNIYIEADEMTVSELNRLSEKLPDISINSTGFLSGIINKIRSIKSDDEVQNIVMAQKIAENALDYVINNFYDGITEKQLALMLNDFMLKNGAEDISFETIALSGKNTSLPHGVPSDKIIKKGDFVLLDFGAVYNGYHSDMTRTFCYGEPTEKMREIYEIVLTAQEKALSLIKQGVKCRDIDAAARKYISDMGYGEFFGHGLGHSVGMEIHEAPACNTRDETPLQKGIIMTCEPGIYLPHEFGVRIEDMIVITDNSFENLTSSQKNLFIIN